MPELKEYLNAINYTKENLMEDSLYEKKYPAWVVNHALYAFPDTILLVNEMNINNQLDSKLQFDFLLNSIRPRKRFAPWLKTSKVDNLELVKEYFGYSDQKAKDALDLLTDDDIENIRIKLNKGGNE
ncbi:MAG: DNA polymerase [bacterium TMED46]|nr:MAG: DNA polymerase [bacterium TMED46]|tara:strand:+ start:3320 stop:3700 length:381 start_codon:yes stop_codon:yes gene_type:complete